MFKVLPWLVTLGPTSIVNSDLRGMFYNTATITAVEESSSAKEMQVCAASCMAVKGSCSSAVFFLVGEVNHLNWSMMYCANLRMYCFNNWLELKFIFLALKTHSWLDLMVLKVFCSLKILWFWQRPLLLQLCFPSRLEYFCTAYQKKPKQTNKPTLKIPPYSHSLYILGNKTMQATTSITSNLVSFKQITNLQVVICLNSALKWNSAITLEDSSGH